MTPDKSAALDYLLRVLAPDLPLPLPVAEHVFAPPRRWRFDRAWITARVAVEVDGGQWAQAGGRHARDGDRAKLNRAAALGWRVLRVSPQMLEADPESFITDLRAALCWRVE